MASETHGSEAHVEGHIADHVAEHGAGGVGDAFPPFDINTFSSQLFWLAIAFVVLYVLLSRVILPKLGGIIEQRKNTIVSDLDDAARMKAEADLAAADMEKSLAAARADARARAEATRNEIDKKIAQLSAEKSVELDGKLSEAEARIDEMKTKAMANVATIATSTTSAILGQLGVTASEADIAASVARSTGEVAA